jgi:hypothetical protein
MKRTLLNDITELLAHRPNSQGNEVLFFLPSHSFLNFWTDAQANPKTKQIEQIFSRFYLHLLHHPIN